MCMEMMLNTLTEVLTLGVADQTFKSAFLDMCQLLAMQGTSKLLSPPLFSAHHPPRQPTLQNKGWG